MEAAGKRLGEDGVRDQVRNARGAQAGRRRGGGPDRDRASAGGGERGAEGARECAGAGAGGRAGAIGAAAGATDGDVTAAVLVQLERQRGNSRGQEKEQPSTLPTFSALTDQTVCTTLDLAVFMRLLCVISQHILIYYEKNRARIRRNTDRYASRYFLQNLTIMNFV